MTVADLFQREVLGRILDRAMRDTGPLRRELLAPLRGRVVEIGFGSGENLAYLPAAVEELVAIEPSHGLVQRARPAIERARAKVTVLERSASRPLPLDAASFDAAVITFVLCSVKHVDAMLAETRRLLRPGAPLFVAEHVRAPDPRTLFVQRAVRPVWRVILGGCDPTFDARGALERAGFDGSDLRAVELPFPYPVRTGLVGIAR